MNVKMLSLAAVLLISACAPTFPWGPGNTSGVDEYEWVGLHCVDEANNPAKDGSVGFGPFGLKTSIIFFKQVKKDGTISEVQHPKC